MKLSFCQNKQTTEPGRNYMYSILIDCESLEIVDCSLRFFQLGPRTINNANWYGEAAGE